MHVFISRIKWWLRRRRPSYLRQAVEDRGRRAEFYARNRYDPQPLLTEPPPPKLPLQIQAAVDKANAYYTETAAQ